MVRKRQRQIKPLCPGRSLFDVFGCQGSDMDFRFDGMNSYKFLLLESKQEVFPNQVSCGLCAIMLTISYEKKNFLQQTIWGGNDTLRPVVSAFLAGNI